jgi:hypothetical protein
MAEHTPEPWKVVDDVDVESGPQGALWYVSTAGARGRTLDEARANARRIVAAVNACAGLPTEVLEANALDSTVGRLVIQRADLLAELTRLRGRLQAMADAELDGDVPRGSDLAREAKCINQAITKAEGG